jgi:hypothetical protein
LYDVDLFLLTDMISESIHLVECVQAIYPVSWDEGDVPDVEWLKLVAFQ